MMVMINAEDVIVTKFSCLYVDGNGGGFTQGGCAFPTISRLGVEFALPSLTPFLSVY